MRFKGTELRFGKVRKLWRWTAEMVPQPVNALNATDCTLRNASDGEFYVVYILPQ